MYKSLYERFKKFDWTWFYADEYLSKWADEEAVLKNILSNLKCPYTFRQIESAIMGFIIEDSVLKEDGYYLKVDLDKQWNMAPLSESEMLHKDLAIEIIDWLKKQ